jgi:hypothetical protein
MRSENRQSAALRRKSFNSEHGERERSSKRVKKLRSAASLSDVTIDRDDTMEVEDSSDHPTAHVDQDRHKAAMRLFGLTENAERANRAKKAAKAAQAEAAQEGDPNAYDTYDPFADHHEPVSSPIKRGLNEKPRKEYEPFSSCQGQYTPDEDDEPGFLGFVDVLGGADKVQRIALLLLLNAVVASGAFLITNQIVPRPPKAVIELPSPRLHAQDMPDAVAEVEGVRVRRFVGD